MSHKTLIQAVEEALDDLFSDTTVSRNTTYGDLSDIRANIDIKMESLKEDMKRVEKSGARGK